MKDTDTKINLSSNSQVMKYMQRNNMKAIISFKYT